jgi:plasmid stabilization system protein ParE
MRIRYTRRARRDLGSISDYVSEHNPRAAKRVKAQIVH